MVAILGRKVAAAGRREQDAAQLAAYPVGVAGNQGVVEVVQALITTGFLGIALDDLGTKDLGYLAVGKAQPTAHQAAVGVVSILGRQVARQIEQAPQGVALLP